MICKYYYLYIFGSTEQCFQIIDVFEFYWTIKLQQSFQLLDMTLKLYASKKLSNTHQECDQVQSNVTQKRYACKS